MASVLRRALVAFGVNHRIAGGAVFGDADVIHAGLLAAELIEEAFDHFGAFRDALAGVRDAGLADPLLKIVDMLVDVVVDVGEDFFQIVGSLAEVGLDGFIAVRADAELLRADGPSMRRSASDRWCRRRTEKRS